MIRIFLIILFLAASSPPVSADFKSGGDAYKRGDYETAAREFLPLAEKGDHRAMYALGSMYAGGQGVPQDLKEAMKWFRKAAIYGRPDAMFKIGLMYDEGHGVEADSKQAVKWYGKSATSGYSLAQFKVGEMYAQGRGVKQNPAKAYAWLKLASANGLNDADNLITSLEKEMTPEQLEEAERLTREYMDQYANKQWPMTNDQ